ncbi:hypothetical protein BGX38DRAFT_1159018, partial [Terfezia claveryi]
MVLLYSILISYLWSWTTSLLLHSPHNDPETISSLPSTCVLFDSFDWLSTSHSSRTARVCASCYKPKAAVQRVYDEIVGRNPSRPKEGFLA